MAIFNSLGSNYDFKYVLRSLCVFGTDKHKNLLKKYLSEKYLGQAFLFEKGREATEYGLKKLSLPEKSKVAITGFTCYAVYDAVTRSGLEPVYLDIEPGTINFSLNKLKDAVKKDKKIKAVIIQNTLGFSQEGIKIKKYCKDNDLILIEDLAHSVGAKYNDSVSAGELGDVVIFSFSQDKLVDGVSGGALVWRGEKIDKPEYNTGNTFSSIKIRAYPFLTFLIRSTYGIGLGKILHFIFRKLNILSGPMDKDDGGFHDISGRNSSLILDELKNLKRNLDHRRKIARTYLEEIDTKLQLKYVKKDILNSSNVRFPIVIEKRDQLITHLAKNGIYVSDVWFDSPISPKKHIGDTNYVLGSCPEAEEISVKILNLPTHTNVNENDAQKISSIINRWQKL